MNGDKVLDKLGEALSLYLVSFGENYESLYTDDTNDFRRIIHNAQRIVMSKQLRELRKQTAKEGKEL